MTIWRLRVAEAICALAAARLLIAGAGFRRWRSSLGPLMDGPADKGPGARPTDRTLARAVMRAAQRLPFETKCLPRAMALHWMLRRRKRPSELIIATLPQARRGTLDDLHAWVEIGGEVVIGESGETFYPLARFGTATKF